MQAPFPYFGGKARIAPMVWQHFGNNVARFIDPFCGSLAVPLAAPYEIKKRIFNDSNALLINAWRAIRYAPDEVLYYADRPIAELELRALHRRMKATRPELARRVEDDDLFCDTEMAGVWIFGMCGTIGNHWAADRYPNSVPKLTAFQNFSAWRASGDARERLHALSDYLAGSLITCGDWRRVVTNVVLFHDSSETNVTAVFLDPPYEHENRETGIYCAHDDGSIMADVIAWCLKYGADARLRIVLCKYDDCPELEKVGWQRVAWKAQGGYSNQRATHNANPARERVYFSPHCECEREGHQLALGI